MDPGRCRDAHDLERNLATRRIAEGLQTAQRRELRNGEKGADPEAQELLQLIARLSLHHEDILAALLQQHQFVLHLKGGQGSLLPLMMPKVRAGMENLRS